MSLGFGYNRGRDAPRHGGEVWIKLCDAVLKATFELLFDFGEVPVLGHAMCFHTFVLFAVMKSSATFLPRRAAAVAIDDDTFAVNESGF